MALSVGEKLGLNEILAPIRKDGMGERTRPAILVSIASSRSKFPTRSSANASSEKPSIGALNPVQGECMNRLSFLGTSAASLIAAGVSNARFALCDTAPRTQRDDLNPTGIRTAGIR